MNLLSLFNGCSGAYMALDEAGINVNKYYVSEVDKFANQAAKAIYPDSIFLGDVRYVDVSRLEKIDLVCGGTPCTDLSFAGKQSGLICNTFEDYLELRNEWLLTGNEDLYFHNGKFQQSILFWEYVRILRDIQKYNPDVYFFLENVDMNKSHMKVINDTLGLAGQNINSNLVSAQNRNRWYWTNISTRKQGLFGDIETYIEPPEDRGIFIKDIIEYEVDEKYYIKNPKFNFYGMNINGKANTQRTGGSCSQTNKHNYDLIKLDVKGNKKADQSKASCFTAGANSGGNHSDMDVLCVAMRGRNPENPSDRRTGSPTEQRLEPQKDGKTNCISTVSKDNLVLLDWSHRNEGVRKYYDKSPTITARDYKEPRQIYNGYRLRRLTPLEVMILQTVPEKFQKILLESGISDSQLYKMMGNGWTILMITEYFKHIKL